MLRPLFRTALALAILATLFPTVTLSNWMTLVFASLVLTFLNSIIRPILQVLLLPINFVTLGFASIVVSGGLLWLATVLVPGFQVEPMVVLGIYINQFFSLIIVSSMIGGLFSLIKVLI